jgi:DNA mismatch repair ATPase MutS
VTVAECIEEIRRVIADALLQSSALATYYDPEVLESLETAHKRYRNFMRAAEDAHLGHAVVLLYSLQETRSDTSNFIQLGRLIESETGTPPSEIPRFHEILEEAKPFWKKVAIVRNQVFGHRSAERSRDECFKLAGLTPNDLVDLTQLYEEAINSITSWRGEPSWKPIMDVGPDLKRVIALLGAQRI